MTVDNNETIDPTLDPTGQGSDAGAGEPSQAGHEGNATHLQTKQEKALWYQKRQEQKIKREYEAKLAELEQKASSGQLEEPSPDEYLDAVKEKDVQVRALEAKNFVLENPMYQEHAEQIQAKINDTKYQNLGVDEIAKLVAADALINGTKERNLAAQHDTGGGASARGAQKEVFQPGKLQGNDLALYIEQVKSGQI